MKVALVHEFLTQLGGAERVLQTFHELFPEAKVFTLVYDRAKTQGVFAKWDVRPSFLQKLPGGVKSYKWYLSLMPKAIESFDLSGYDLVISDSSAFAKGVITKKPTIHICYCHTPTRYLWESMDEYVNNIPYPWFVKLAVRPYLQYLKRWDHRAAKRPDFFIANSRTVQARIKKYYNRDAEVIYPPVDTEFFRPLQGTPPNPLFSSRGGSALGGNQRGGVKGEFYFTASRLEPYKKIDLVIEAFNQLNLPLKVAGSGTQLLNLKSKILNPKIEFLGRVSDEELRKLYSCAKAFIFPALEDAGIMVLEALACGTPVIGLGQGGTAEFIQDGVNGILVEEQTIANFFPIGKKLAMMRFDPQKLRESALRFDKEIFKKRILKFIQHLET